MKNLSVVHKIIVFSLLILITSGFCTEAQAQRHARKAKERIQQLKLIKLLDILDLSEEKSEKFLAKYKAVEKKFEENKKQMQFALKELEISIQRGDSKEKVNERIDKLMEIDEKHFRLLKEKFNSIKSLLNDEQFAKFVLFEHKFPLEIQRMLIDKRKRMMRRSPRGGEGPPRDNVVPKGNLDIPDDKP